MNNHSSAVLLIDADNTPYSKLEAILAEYDSVAVKRAYGNWSKPCLKNREWVLQRHGIRAVQQFDCAVGKNATDIALAVDAMDLLHSGRYDTFLLAASDSDYAPLALRLRESGAAVIGIGKADTPIAYVSACSLFRTLDSFNTAVDSIDTSFLLDEDEDEAPFGFASEEEVLEMDIEDFPTLKTVPEEDSPSEDPDHIWDTLEVEEEDEDLCFPPNFGLDEQEDLTLQADSRNDDADESIWDSLDDLELDLDEGETGLVDDLQPTADSISFPKPLQDSDSDIRLLHLMLKMVYYACKEENGFAKLSDAGKLIHKLRPGFNYRDYGFKKLHHLLLAYPEKYQVIYYPTKTPAKLVAYRCCA